jgi:hypothetical protein
MLTPRASRSCRKWPRPEPRDPTEDLGEQRSRHRHFGQLEHDVAAVAGDSGTDLDQLLAQGGERSLLDLLRQRQRAQKVGEIVGERVQLEAYSVVPEGMAGEPRPAERVLALFDPLLSRPTAVIELDHSPVGSTKVGHDEADAAIKPTLVPLGLGDHPTGSGPALGLVVEAGVGHDRLLGWSTDRPLEELADPLLQDLIGRQPDGVANIFGLQQLVDLRLGEGCIGAEVQSDAALTLAGDHRL